MHSQPALSMVSLHELTALLQARMSDLLVVSDAYSWIVKVISWFFITLALSMGLPIAVLIGFDFFLWVYRLVFPTPATVSRARQTPDPLSHQIKTTS